MLLEQTDQLIKSLKDFKTLQDSSNESQKFIGRNTELNAISVYLENISSIVFLFRKEGFSVDIDDIINYAAELFNNLYKTWLEDKKSIIKPNDFFRRVDLKNIESEIRDRLQKQWQDFIENKKPSINMEQLNVLEQIPDLSNVVYKLKVKLEQLDELKDELPLEEDDFKLVISSSSKMDGLLKQLSSSNIPDPVSNFLRKAGTIEGIDLSEITTEILAWLKENNLIHLCQVKFRK